MSKKDDEKDDHDDDADLEHEEHAEDEDDEEKVVAAKPAADRRRARARALRFEDDDDHGKKGHDDHDHDHDDDDDEPFEDDDPTWWAPHAVMGGLVVIGVLGFFGVFNRAANAMMGHPQPVAAVESSVPATAPPPNTGAQPMHPPMPGQPPGAQPNKEMFGAKHLLVMYKGSRRAPPNVDRSQEDAKKRATEAMKKAKAGAKFEDLVKEYSDEPGAGARGGDLGKFPKGSMVPEFQTALEKIKVGEVSDVVETPFGYHVILRTQ